VVELEQQDHKHQELQDQFQHLNLLHLQVVVEVVQVVVHLLEIL
jgi:hypothetical protein|tara:strand:- start:1189 stop:1320 length:132 start_codon:yes stop_codon:yes gene_type:complete